MTELSLCFLVVVVPHSFGCPGSGSELGLRIRILTGIADPDPYRDCGSGSVLGMRFRVQEYGN
jgi:hypothetical protein